jgi:hypothetical protein
MLCSSVLAASPVVFFLARVFLPFFYYTDPEGARVEHIDFFF